MPEEWDIDEEDRKPWVQPVFPVNWGTVSHQWIWFLSPTSYQSVWGMQAFLKGDSRMMNQRMHEWDRNKRRIGEGEPRTRYGYHPTDFMGMAATLNAVSKQLAEVAVWGWKQARYHVAGSDGIEGYIFQEYTPAIGIESINGHSVDSNIADLMISYKDFPDGWYQDYALEDIGTDLSIKGAPHFLPLTKVSRREKYSSQTLTPLADMGGDRLSATLGYLPALTWHTPTGLVSAIYNDLAGNSGSDAFIQIVAHLDWSEVWERNNEAMDIHRIDIQMEKLLNEGMVRFVEWLNRTPEEMLPVRTVGGAGTTRDDVVKDEIGREVRYNWGQKYPVNWITGETMLVKRANSISEMREDMKQGNYVSFQL